MQIKKRLFISAILASMVVGIGLRHYGPKIAKRVALYMPARIELTTGVPIQFLDQPDDQALSAPEEYWGRHTVNSIPHATADQSLEYLDWRSRQYPLFYELMNHFGHHDNEVVLDYGCGPGNDVVGFLAHTNARRIIGMDVSKKALRLASHRLSLHKNFDLSRVELIQVDDKTPTIPLPDRSVDYIYSEGVLHHTSNPEAIVKEFHRVLKPNGKVAIMVYNADSLWKHLYVAYQLQLLDHRFTGMTLDEAFTRSTDGEECPIAHNYTPAEFTHICDQAGFHTTYVGGFFSVLELDLYHSLRDQAVLDSRLPKISRNFLRSLKTDLRGFPTYEGKHVGVGAVYTLRKEAA